MRIHEASFVISNTNPGLAPDPDRPEYAFIGRSNVGKSSLINMLTDRKKLAKTSGRPGKTQLINHFNIVSESGGKKSSWYLVDLPGYGFAKASKSEIAKWEKFIRRYLLTRKNLLCTFVLVDIRHEPQKIDLEFMEWLGLSQIPFAIIFTKADKLSKTKVDSHLAAYKKDMLRTWDELPPMFVTSATEKTGQQAVLDYVDEVNGVFDKDAL